MGTAIKHLAVPDRVKSSFAIFYFRALWRIDAQPWASECPDVNNYKGRFNPVWHSKMFYSCTHVATVGVKGLMSIWEPETNKVVMGSCCS